MSGLTPEALPDCLPAKPGSGRWRRWGPGGRVRAVAVGAVLAVTAAAVAALGPAGPAAAVTSAAASYAEAWGQGTWGQLGNGSTANQSSPVALAAPSQVTQVSGGLTHTVAVRADGTVWAWGDNRNGALGNGTTTASSSPVQVTGLTGIVQVAAGVYDSLALRSDGTVWAWGYNAYGELGDGTTTDHTIPVQVAGLTGVTQIAAGAYHSLAVRLDGTAVAWGRNDQGALGDGTRAARTTPLAVSGLTNVTQIAGGWEHSVALRSDGTVVAWGSNRYGELGDGTITRRTTPVQVAGLTGVTQIATGEGDHSLAVRSDGTVAAWGYNGDGELGDGTTTNRTTTVTVSGLSDVARVSAGGGHSVAVRSDGTVVAWGNNVYGQLGDGTTTTRHIPVDVPGLSSVTQVSAGITHTVAKVGPPELTAKAAISGIGKVGRTLTCKAAFVGATSVSYTWLLDATTIPGATSATYTPVAADAYHQATCQVTGTNSLGSTAASATISVHADAAPTATLSVPAYTRTSTTTATITVADTDDPTSSLSVSCRVDSAAWTPCRPGAWPVPAQKPGTHVLSVKVTDPSARTTTASRNWVVDQLSPTVTLRGPAQPFTLASSIPLSWTGSDAGSGIAYYQVRWNKAAYNGGFGAWQYPTAWQKLTSATVTLTGAVPAVGYCFQTRAVDKVGNTGAWSAQKCSAVALDDRSLAASAGWSRVAWSLFYRGTATQTSKAGAYLARPGAALRRVALVATRCPSCGTVGIYINGTSVGTVNLYSATTLRKAVIALPPFSYRTGTVTLKVLSTGKLIQVDGLGISRA